MAIVLIDFDLPDFQDSFAWEGDGNTAQRVAEAARRSTTLATFDPPDEYMLRTLVQAPLLLNDPRTREETQAVITAFVLQLPTQDVDWPGVIGDYLAACDIAVNIRETAGRVYLQSWLCAPERHRRRRLIVKRRLTATTR